MSEHEDRLERNPETLARVKKALARPSEAIFVDLDDIPPTAYRRPRVWGEACKKVMERVESGEPCADCEGVQNDGS